MSKDINLDKICTDLMRQILLLIWMTSSVNGIDPESGGTVQRLMSQQNSLIQPGLSFIDDSNFYHVRTKNLFEIHNSTMSKSQVSCCINIVNWSKWLLDNPSTFYKYGHNENGKLGLLIISVFIAAFDSLKISNIEKNDRTLRKQ